MLAWLEYIQVTEEPSDRDLLILTRDVFRRFAAMLPDLISALNAVDSETVHNEHDGLLGPSIKAPVPRPIEPEYEILSARVRRHPHRDKRERQCIGPVIGRRGSCLGKGAATNGWQDESADNFSRKRNHFQARCKACDGLRIQGRQLTILRRASAARQWKDISSKAQDWDSPRDQLDEIRKLSLSFLEDLRDEWWQAMHRQALRLLEIRGDQGDQVSQELGSNWLAIDIDDQLVFTGHSPDDALEAAQNDDDDRLFLLLPRRTP